MGSSQATPEEEIASHTKRFEKLLARKLNVHSPRAVFGIEPGTELVIYDFGGLLPGTDLMERNARELVKWAEDNPSSLVVVVSGFTYQRYVWIEMEDRGLTQIPNITCDDVFEREEHGQKDVIPEWWKAGLK
jgi:hypothetical protein